MQKRILTAGEPMGLFIAKEEAKLEDVHNFSVAVAGAEFNVAVGLTRLGHQVGYVTKLGKDLFGRQIRKMMGNNGIDDSLTKEMDEKTTGFMFKSKTSQGDPDIYYCRKGSAASTISQSDIEGLDLKAWDAIHLTGILPAVSESAYGATELLMKKGRKLGIPIFFDPNLRPQLWSSEAAMIEGINHLAALADYVMPGENEGKILCGSADPEVIGRFYLQLGAKAVIVKTGADGARVFTEENAFHVHAYPPEKIVDTVGAGDGFAAGVISGVMEGLPLEEAVQRGCAIGTIQLMVVSDNEGLPTREELAKFMAEHKQN